MDYVLDFARTLTSASPGAGPSRGPSRGKRRNGAGLLVQLRIAILGVMLGLALPTIKDVDWRTLLPGGVTVELPTPGRVTWPAGEIGLPPGLGVTAVSAVSTGLAAAGGGADRGGTDRGGDHGGTTVNARFGRCRRGVVGDCVVDGDTFRLNGEKVRIADIDTPETHPPRCAREARAGEAATERMRALLNAGPVTLEPYKRARDKYGRRLAVVTRDGVSLGETLVAEGLARRYDGGKRRGWCGWLRA